MERILKKYPLDFGVYARYSSQLGKKLQDRFTLPEALRLEEVSEFMAGIPHHYKVSLTPPPSQPHERDKLNKA